MLRKEVVHLVAVTHAMSVYIRIVVSLYPRKRKNRTLNVLFAVNELINNVYNAGITTARLPGWATLDALQRCIRKVVEPIITHKTLILPLKQQKLWKLEEKKKRCKRNGRKSKMQKKPERNKPKSKG